MSTIEAVPTNPDVIADLLGELPPAPVADQIAAALEWEHAGAHLEAGRKRRLVRELIRTGHRPSGGRAIGTETGASFANVPDTGFVIAPEVFEQATIRHTWQSPQRAFPGFGLPEQLDLPNRGLLAELELVFNGTYTRTDGAGTHTVTDYGPYGLLENIELAVNGSPLKSAGGLAYEFRRQVVTRKAPDSMTSTPTNAGANQWDLRWRIPVADNMRNLWGALLAQADDLYVTLAIAAAAKSRIAALTSNADIALAGNFRLVFIGFDVPLVTIEGMGPRHVLPDTDVLHRFHQYSQPVISTGETRLKLQRTAGEVERVFLWLDNTNSTLMDPSSWDEVRFAYMATEEPLRWPAKSLLSENARNYNGRITPKAAVIDLSVYNQKRDALYPRAVADPEIVVTIPSGVTVNAGARLFAVQESLVGGA
jgi:hypothetical protein